jgi:hypothetical protein
MKFCTFIVLPIFSFFCVTSCFTDIPAEQQSATQQAETAPASSTTEIKNNKNFSTRDIENIKKLAAICSIGPTARTLILGPDDHEDLLLASRLSSAIHSGVNAALEDYDLLASIKTYLDKLSRLQVANDTGSFLGLNPFNAEDYDAEKVKWVSLFALIQELGTQSREFCLKKIFPDDDKRIARRVSRVFLTTISEALFEFIFYKRMHSLISNAIMYSTEEICGELIMRSLEWKGKNPETPATQ